MFEKYMLKKSKGEYRVNSTFGVPIKSKFGNCTNSPAKDRPRASYCFLTPQIYKLPWLIIRQSDECIVIIITFFFLFFWKNCNKKIGEIIIVIVYHKFGSLAASLLIRISPRHMDKNNNKKKSFSNILDSYSPPSFCFSWIKKWCVIQKLFIVPQSHMTIFSNKFIFELLLQSRST